MKKIHSIILSVFVMLMVCALPVSAGEDEDDSSSGSSAKIDYQKWFSPAESLNEVEKSPAGAPLMKLTKLVVGGVLIYGFYRIIKEWAKMKYGNGESASDGYLGMGHATFGMFVLAACIAFYFYFASYKF